MHRSIPSVDSILRRDEIQTLVARHGRALVKDTVREILAGLRDAGSAAPADGDAGAPADLSLLVERSLRRKTDSKIRRVINATGVVVHTNLGRTVLSEEARARVMRVASSYCTLEYDLEKGERGSRSSHIEDRLALLFPGAGALAVNNNAAAVFLAINTLCEGKEAIISRGELVEIGGSFRIPDVMAKSGAGLREVGTTNRTRLSDYEQAVGPGTGLILKVHPSNFKVVGFTQQVDVPELASLARRHGLPLVVDQGSGCLLDLTSAGVGDEPTVHAMLEGGADIVTFSSDKLMGGPQAGLVVGRRDLVDQMRRSPLYRVLRLDKMTIAALEATLEAHVRGTARDEVPAIRMILASREEIGARAERVAGLLRPRVEGRALVTTRDGASRVGGGAAPTADLPTVLMLLTAAGGASTSVAAWQRELREASTRGVIPVVARVQDDALVIDLRTVDPAEENDLVESLAAALQAC